MTLKRILLMGRPNVGKSSLFNAMLGFRRSIVLDLPGTTVDFVWENHTWEKREDGETKNFSVTLGDAMGLHTSADIKGVFKEIQAADAVLWVVDLSSGLAPMDQEIADTLRRAQVPVLIVANKSDAATEHGSAFLKIGFKDWVETSAVHRRGLDEIHQWLESYATVVPVETEEEAKTGAGKIIKLAILGKPNSGKSTLTNLLSGKKVSKVSPVALTTRDPIFIETEREGQKYLIMDTAGLRRPRSEMSQVEKFSVHASTRTIREADVVLLMIAAHEPISDQDMRLLNLLKREGKPTLVLLNFWDKLAHKERQVFLKDSEFVTYLKDFRVLPISAAEGFDTDRILPLVSILRTSSQRRIKTSKLNDIVGQLIEKNPPPTMAGYPVNIMFTSQVRVNPPTFLFFTSRPHLISDSYKRYLEKGIRERFGYKSQPVKLIFKNKNPKAASPEK